MLGLTNVDIIPKRERMNVRLEYFCGMSVAFLGPMQRSSTTECQFGVFS